MIKMGNTSEVILVNKMANLRGTPPYTRVSKSQDQFWRPHMHKSKTIIHDVKFETYSERETKTLEII